LLFLPRLKPDIPGRVAYEYPNPQTEGRPEGVFEKGGERPGRKTRLNANVVIPGWPGLGVNTETAKASRQGIEAPKQSTGEEKTQSRRRRADIVLVVVAPCTPCCRIEEKPR
jgi:hypothetical protein